MLKRPLTDASKTLLVEANSKSTGSDLLFRKTRNPPLDSEDRDLFLYCLIENHYVVPQAMASVRH